MRLSSFGELALSFGFAVMLVLPVLERVTKYLDCVAINATLKVRDTGKSFLLHCDKLTIHFLQ